MLTVPVPYNVNLWGKPYGAEEPPAAGTSSDQYVQQAAQFYATYSQQADPRVQEQMLLARISNLRQMKARYPFAAVFIDGELTKAKAKLKAVREKRALQLEGESATRDWRTLGQLGTGVGIVFGIAATATVVILAAKIARS
jgi:hypothetical protein